MSVMVNRLLQIGKFWALDGALHTSLGRSVKSWEHQMENSGQTVLTFRVSSGKDELSDIKVTMPGIVVAKT